MYNEIFKVCTETNQHQPFLTSPLTSGWAGQSQSRIKLDPGKQAWCLACSACYFENIWGLGLSKMASITTDNKTEFERYTWILCFGHNLHLAVCKALSFDCLKSLVQTFSSQTKWWGAWRKSRSLIYQYKSSLGVWVCDTYNVQATLQML